MKRIVIAAFLGVAVVAALAFSPKEYARASSPDGRHVAIAKYRSYLAWLPMSPGSSGDKNGWIVITTIDGKKIGVADVDMVSQIQDLRWTQDSVEVRLVATIKL
jgi:hypothetical protein